MHYLKFKKDQVGKCNICGQEAKLTWDHVPPKGGQLFTEVEQESIFEYLVGKKERRSKLSQNGVKYRTICGNCNNTVLGAKCDPVLNEFAMDVMLMIKTSILLPKSTIKVQTKPALVSKAILGHMLSVSGEYGQSKFDQSIREYVLDDSAVAPKGIKIFYWVYPHMSIKIIRDVAMPRLRGNWEDFRRGGVGIFSIMKYPPLGYIVTNLDSYEGLNELTQCCGSNLGDEAEVPIRLSEIYPEYWPEAGDNTFLMGGGALANGVSAVPRIKKEIGI